MFEGVLANITEEDSAGTPNTPGTYFNTGSLVEELTELTDIPEPTFSDPDVKIIEVRDPELPKSDHILDQYKIDSWFQDPSTNP